MRKALIALAAVPVVATLYLPLLVRRRVATRVALICGAGAIIAFGALAVSSPRGTRATEATTPATVPAAAFRPIVVSHGLIDPIIVDFTGPMDRQSVEESLTVSPPVDIRIAWASDGRSMAVWPTDAWLPGTFHTLAIGPTAHDTAGTGVGRTLSSMFLTRQGVAGTLALAGSAKAKPRADSRLVVRFDGAVDVSSAIAAFRSTPAVVGTWAAEGPNLGTTLVFTPTEPLAPATAYTFTFEDGITDLEGAPLGVRPTLSFETTAAPRVIRFRPRTGWTDVPRDQDISVRFDRKMNRPSTKAAFSVTIGGKPIAGTVRWAEGDTVLVLSPAKDLPHGAKVVMTVAASAKAADGAVLGKDISGSFKVVPKPVVRVAATTTARTAKTTPISRPTGGGSTGSATWLAVEKYYHKLLSCTRGGGLVTSSGSCSSPGGSGLTALKLDSGISSKVARPYAKKLAQAGVCDHFYGGTTPGTRLKRAGYGNYTWGENIGCRNGSSAYASVLGSHLYFQSERSYNGGHWKNMMNPRYDRVGIGVWVSSGRVRLVIDFYHP